MRIPAPVYPKSQRLWPVIEATTFCLVVSHCFFFAEIFWSIFCWDILVICLTIATKLAVSCSLVYIFRHSDRKGLIFLVISKIFRPMTEKKPGPHCFSPRCLRISTCCYYVSRRLRDEWLQSVGCCSVKCWCTFLSFIARSSACRGFKGFVLLFFPDLIFVADWKVFCYGTASSSIIPFAAVQTVSLLAVNWHCVRTIATMTHWDRMKQRGER